MSTRTHYTIPQVVDNTILSTVHACGTKAKYEFLANLRPGAVSIDLHAGGCFAHGIEIAYRSAYAGDTRDMTLAKAHFAFTKMWGDFVSLKDTPKTKGRVWDAVEYYIEQFNPPHDYIEPARFLGPNQDPFEYTFALLLEPGLWGFDWPLHPSGDPFIYGGRFDMIGEQLGQPRIRDDKTTTGIGPKWHEQFTLRGQFVGYCAVMQHLGVPVDTVEVRGIGILKTELKIGSGFIAVKTYIPTVVDRWKRQAFRNLTRLLAMYNEPDDSEMSFGETCAAYGGCAFLDLCKSPDPESWYSSYEKRNWNPLERQVES